MICLISVIASQRSRPSNNNRSGSYHNTSPNTSKPDSGYGSSGQSRSFSTQSSTFQTPNTSYQRGSSNQRLPVQQSRNNNSQISNAFNSPVNIQRGSGGNNRGDNSRVPLLPVQPFNRGQSSDDNSVVCNCGEDGVLLTVRKEGPNTGMILLFI